MSAESELPNIGLGESSTRVNEFRRFIRVFLGRPLVVIGLVIVVIFLITAAFAPWLAPQDPYMTHMDDALAPPSTAHFLGTDYVGRDTFSRLIVATRVTLFVGVIALSIAAGIGMTLGLVAGYFVGVIGSIIMRLADALMAFPMILLALIIAVMLGGGIRNLMIAIGISLVPGYIRLMYAMVISAKENDYVLAARSIGCSDFRLMVRHILPNCMAPFIVLITLMMGTAILAEAGLSFLGVGVTSPGAAWGSMVSDGYKYLLTNPVLSFAPGIAIMLVVFGFNMVGDGLRDALDPRLRGAL